MSDFETEWDRTDFESVPTLAENAVYLLPGCNDTLLRKSLQQAYRDFCRRSAALRTWRPIHLQPRVDAYPIAPLLSGEIDCVTQVVWAHGRRLVHGWRVMGDDPPMLHLPERMAWLFTAPPPPPRNGFVQEFVQEHENVGVTPVEVSEPPPDTPKPPPFSVLMVETVEIPHINEERAPRSFLRRYGDAIVDGALVRMFSMTGKAWTDAEQARQHGVAYENAISEARQRGMQGGPAANAGSTFALDLSGMV